jgi:hypothetical protein
MRFIVHRNDQNRDSREHRPQILDQLKPALSGQIQIRDDQVGPALFDDGHRLIRIRGFAANHHVTLGIDELGDAHPHEGMIIDKHNAFAGGA